VDASECVEPERLQQEQQQLSQEQQQLFDDQQQGLDERQRLTEPIALVFTDMVGSSAAKRAASLGADASSRDRAYLANIQTRHLRVVREALSQYGGREIMTIGDSFFLTFEDPTRAVLCCAAIQQRLRLDPIQTAAGPLRLRIGVHMGTPEYFENSWHGTDVDLAARAESVGSAEQIIVTDPARKAIGELPGVKFRKLGAFTLKGVGNVVLWDADYANQGIRHAAVRNNGQKDRLRLYALTVVAALLLATVILAQHWPRQHSSPPNVSVLISDFKNTTGDPAFDHALEQPISTALEDASFINVYSRNQARKLAKEIDGSAGTLDEEAARLVARREGVPYVITGSIERRRGGFALSIRAIDASTGKVAGAETVQSAARASVLKSVPRAVARIRTALGDTTPESAETTAAETYTAGSLEAAKAYETAQDLQWSGNFPQAMKAYKSALALDPQMGRAYSGLAVMEYNSGNKVAAAQYFQQAMANIGRMSERERYRTRGSYYLLQREFAKAIDEYTELIRKYPADSAGHANLAFAYFYARDMDHALKEGMQAVALAPNNVPQRNNVGLYAMYAGDFERALSEQQRVLELNPKFNLAYVSKAISELALGRSEATATWQALSRLNAHGASSAQLGLADLALYEGRLEDAEQLLRKGAADDETAGSKDEAAVKYANLAYAEAYRHNSRDAIASADRAVALSTDDGVQVLAAEAYVHSGAPGKAKAISAKLNGMIENDARAYAGLINGMALLESGHAVPAMAEIRDAQKISDTWLGHFYLGRAYLAARAYAEADSEFDTCLRRSGEATAIFLDEQPTYHLLPLVNYYDGIAREGMHSSAGVQSLQAFLATRRQHQNDPLVEDALRRMVNTTHAQPN
jgi:class 3 adenylate cyclase/tetratricopeptide (TPR) repeat protein